MTLYTYIFLDEAGNLDFSTNGTPYFVLTSVSMRRPFPMYQELDAYRHDCLEYGLEMEYFHCSEDNIHVRNSVFGLIAKNLGSMRIDCLVVEKKNRTCTSGCKALLPGNARIPVEIRCSPGRRHR